ncbi:MAG: hypothetical protein ABEJ72_04090 [Candidatus Aenigmatarchaeota archaeon]
MEKQTYETELSPEDLDESREYETMRDVDHKLEETPETQQVWR